MADIYIKGHCFLSNALGNIYRDDHEIKLHHFSRRRRGSASTHLSESARWWPHWPVRILCFFGLVADLLQIKGEGNHAITA